MTAPSSLTVRINIKVVLIVLAVAVPLLLADMFLVLDRSSNALTATIGTQTEALAKVTASEVNRWIRPPRLAERVCGHGFGGHPGGLLQHPSASGNHRS